MATVQIHKTGAEYLLRTVITGESTRVTTVTVGLFDDSTDALTHTSDYADITTEPSDGNYTAQSVDLDTDSSTTLDDDNWTAVLGQIDFDVASTTGSVDSYYVTVTDNLSGDDEDTQHLFWTGSLDQTYDLNQIDVFRIDADTAGVKVIPDTA